jgi:hypothetical protein
MAMVSHTSGFSRCSDYYGGDMSNEQNQQISSAGFLERLKSPPVLRDGVNYRRNHHSSLDVVTESQEGNNSRIFI